MVPDRGPSEEEDLVPGVSSFEVDKDPFKGNYEHDSADESPRSTPRRPATTSELRRGDLKRMKSLLRVQNEPGEMTSDLSAALEEYHAMAERLVHDFMSREYMPQAEAFIEEICIMSILAGCVFVGHIKTDLDSVAGAIGAAELWRGVAARSEVELNGEIKHALKYAGLEAPPLFDLIPGAAVPDVNGKLLGVCLVDHNETKQMVDSLKNDKCRSKRIRGLVDHHCLSEGFSSEKAMYIDLRPWGSMSTIVAHSFIRNNRPIPMKIARILLAAILSDTLNLQSVTTTSADRMMVTLLSVFGDVEDPSELARDMFRAKTEWIVNLGAYEMTRGDQKDFTCEGWKIGIAVLEVTDIQPVLDVARELLLELRILKVEKGKDKTGRRDRRNYLDFAYLFVVDVTRQCSKLLICGARELALAKATFADGKLSEAAPGIEPVGKHIGAAETMMDVGNLVSRKAQFVPAFFEALRSGFTCHKKPMSEIPEAEAFQELDGAAQDVLDAINIMDASSTHYSNKVLRDYKPIDEAYKREATAATKGWDAAKVLVPMMPLMAKKDKAGVDSAPKASKSGGHDAAKADDTTKMSHARRQIKRMGSLLRVQAQPGEMTSKVAAAVEEYQAMAHRLVDDFMSREEMPQAEAFIEEICVTNILAGCVFIGHVKTDLDSVAGAIAGAELWKGVAARSEVDLNGEIIYALEFAGLEAPPLFDDIPGAASPAEDGTLLGVCLVDHNEEKQMVDCLKNDKNRSRRIRGVVDHHCLSESFSSEKATYIDLRPWGSVSTIIAHTFIRNNRPIPKKTARILTCAILSDTLNLQSVTTTSADRMMVTLLSVFGEVEDPSEVATRMFREKTKWIVNLGPYEMTRGDQKDFCCQDWKFGISVLEVTVVEPVLKVASELLLELRMLKADKGKDPKSSVIDRRKELDFAFLFVVDVTRQRSKLLICGGRELALAKAAFPKGELMEATPGIVPPGSKITAAQTTMDVGGIVSRKAQFVPAFFEALNAGFTYSKPPMSRRTTAELTPSAAKKQVREAMHRVDERSQHDSHTVVRNYAELKDTFRRLSSFEADQQAPPQSTKGADRPKGRIPVPMQTSPLQRISITVSPPTVPAPAPPSPSLMGAAEPDMSPSSTARPQPGTSFPRAPDEPEAADGGQRRDAPSTVQASTGFCARLRSCFDHA